MKFAFTKMHGAGNDFVLINSFTEEIPEDYPALARAVCDRHFGIGADGLMLPFESESGDIKMRIFNPDGSEPEMCGNGIRCFARFIYEKNILRKKIMRVETLAGMIVPELIFDGDGAVSGVKVDMGEPVLERREIPMAGEKEDTFDRIEAAGGSFEITGVSMGNPHCVIFVDDAESFPVSEHGPVIEKSSLFPEKTNVEFAQVRENGNIVMRVWERGAGITLACGTGACATLVAAGIRELTGRKAVLELLGGNLEIEWKENNHVMMTGPAVNVFEGVWTGSGE